VVKIHSPEETIPAEVVDNGDGTYNVSYFAQKPAPITIEVTLEDQPIKDAPFHIEVKSGTDAHHTGFKDFQFTIQTRDKHGQAKTFGGDEFVVQPSNKNISVATRDNGDGTYTASFELAQKETVNFRVFFNGNEISQSPLHIQ